MPDVRKQERNIVNPGDTGDTKKHETGEGGHHHHVDVEDTSGARLLITLVLNLVIPVAQVIGGVFAHSMALLSDAAHNFSDFAAILIAYFAHLVGKKGASVRNTFGYRRVEVMAAVINVVILLGASCFIVYEAVERFQHPQSVLGNIVIWLACVGIVGNGFSAILLHRGSGHNLTVNGWMTASLSLAAMGCFLWGIISVVFSPCHLASIPLIVAYVGGQDKEPRPREAALYSIVFTLGLFITIAPILAIITIQQKIAAGILLILLFAVGHCTPIVVVGSSTALVRKVVANSAWQGAGNWFRKGAGAIICLPGVYFIVNPLVSVLEG
ncbi:MAG: hypothetical protein DRH20_01695 [Deltaproteobacteria bacterium]|nr:MAG: hypothetical protein DRH20_01695 [Deltaproteobacteria bacterium]